MKDDDKSAILKELEAALAALQRVETLFLEPKKAKAQ